MFTRMRLVVSVAMLAAGLATTGSASANTTAQHPASQAGSVQRSDSTSARLIRRDACFRGACGSATYKRTSSNSYKPVNMSVKDTGCDKHPVYIQAGVVDGTYPSGMVWLKKRYNNLGCHAGYVSWSSYIKDWHLPIKDLIFRVCVDDWGSDTCKTAQ
ncbi:hypothetical protein [Sphaerisporangium sp. NPDC051011]|uniref:hypothetical protein n=1 Tax=Sphaerisporangium sp. NPDC051011 TaxID=3155792 RepID=UPI0033CAE944